MQRPIQFVVALTVLGIALTPANLSQSACARKCKELHGVDKDQTMGECYAYQDKTCYEVRYTHIYVDPPANPKLHCVSVSPPDNTPYFFCDNCTDVCPANVLSEATPPAGFASGTHTDCGASQGDRPILECIGTAGS